MEECQDNPLRIAQAVFERTFVITLLLMAFFAYPMGVFPPAFRFHGTAFNNLSFDISIPAVLLLAFLAIPVILLNRWKLRWFMMVPIGIFLGMILWNYPKDIEYVDEFMDLFGYVTIPLAAAILAKKRKLLNVDSISWAALALWLLEVLLGFISIHRHNPVVGTAGNINWMAALLLGLSPWVVYRLYRIFHLKLSKQMSWLIAIPIWLFPTAILVQRCHSRAAELAIISLPAALLLMYFRTRLEKILFGTLIFLFVVAAMLAGYRYIPGKLLRVVEQDVRMPLWSTSVLLMIQHPMGVGGGKFQKYFTPLRKDSTYNTRLFAADMTVHPHDEILNVGAQLGFAAAFAFVLMLLPMFRSGFEDPLLVCARISAFIIVLQSCFDMPLVQPPTSFLGLTVIGLCWPVKFVAQKPRLRLLPLRIGLALLLIGGALTVVCINLQHDIRMRQGRLLKHIAQQQAAAKLHDLANKTYQKAFEAFKSAVTPFSSMKANYEAGVIALNQDAKTNEAETLLDKVAARDPHFAHLNLLFGRLALRKKDYASAYRYFAAECRYYPRSTDAWQNMYNFAVGTKQYEQSMHFEALLREIYLEKARLTFPGDRFDAQQEIFLDAVREKKSKRSIELADAFMNKINHKFTDPLFFELTIGQKWPPFLFKGGFNELDYFYWRYRYQQLELLHNAEIGTDIPKLVKWFTEHYKFKEGAPYTLPPIVMIKREGQPISVYLCFAGMVNSLGGNCVLQLDKDGKPLRALVLMGKVKTHVRLTAQGLHVDRDYSGFSYYWVDLKKGTCEATTRNALQTSMKWIPKQTVMYFATEEYFLRNSILGTIMESKLNFLDKHPPSLRIIQAFEATGHEAPPVPILKEHLYTGALELYQKQFAKASPPKK